jgi:hypothetical protein
MLDLFWQAAPIAFVVAFLTYAVLCVTLLTLAKKGEFLRIPERHRPRWPSINPLDSIRMTTFLFVSEPQNSKAWVMLLAARTALVVGAGVGLAMGVLTNLTLHWGFHLLPP